MTTVTQWFLAGSKPPVNDGDYEYKYGGYDHVFLAKWNGTKFIVADGTFLHGLPVGIRPGDVWRGLAVKPKSGISSLDRRPNEKDVVGEGKQ